MPTLPRLSSVLGVSLSPTIHGQPGPGPGLELAPSRRNSARLQHFHGKVSSYYRSRCIPVLVDVELRPDGTLGAPIPPHQQEQRMLYVDSLCRPTFRHLYGQDGEELYQLDTEQVLIDLCTGEDSSSSSEDDSGGSHISSEEFDPADPDDIEVHEEDAGYNSNEQEEKSDTSAEDESEDLDVEWSADEMEPLDLLEEMDDESFEQVSEETCPSEAEDDQSNHSLESSDLSE